MSRCFGLIVTGNQFHWQIWSPLPQWKKSIERQPYASIQIRCNRKVPLFNKNILLRRFLISSRYSMNFQVLILGLFIIGCWTLFIIYFSTLVWKPHLTLPHLTSSCLIFVFFFSISPPLNRKLGTSSARRNSLKCLCGFIIWIFGPYLGLPFRGKRCLCHGVPFYTF